MLWSTDTWNRPRSMAIELLPAKDSVPMSIVSPGMKPAMPTMRKTIPKSSAPFWTRVEPVRGVAALDMWSLLCARTGSWFRSGT